MLVERSKSEGAMVHSHGYLVVREGGRVERAPVEPCEDDIVVGATTTTTTATAITTPEDESSPTLDGRRTHHQRPHHQKPPALASTLSNLDKLRQSAMNYFDFQPTPILGSTQSLHRGPLVGHRSASALPSVSSPAAAAVAAAAKGGQLRLSHLRAGTPSPPPPPQSCLSPRSLAVYEREDDMHLPETNLYAAAITSSSSLDLSSDDSEDEDDDGEGEDEGKAGSGGGGARPTSIEREARGDGYELDDLLELDDSTTAAALVAPTGRHQQQQQHEVVVFEEGELGGYDTGGDSESRFTTDDESSDDDDGEEGSNDEDDYETPDEEDEEWDTSEEEEMERTLRSIDRGDLGRSSDSIWNQRFQGLVRLRDDENKYQQLAYLAHDFQHAAEVYGRTLSLFTPLSLVQLVRAQLRGPSALTARCMRARHVQGSSSASVIFRWSRRPSSRSTSAASPAERSSSCRASCTPLSLSVCARCASTL
jgi:hypothetical protein